MGDLLLVGCGKMGGAMLEGWLARGLAAADVVVAEPVDALRPRTSGVRAVASTSDVAKTPEIVVLAVKPQSMDGVLPDLKRFADEGAKVGSRFEDVIGISHVCLLVRGVKLTIASERSRMARLRCT